MVVEFVTKRRRWPARAQPPDGVDGAGDRLTGNVQHAVDVQQNRRHGRRVYSVGRSPSASPARAGPGGQHAQKSSTRVEALFDVEASAGADEAERTRVLDRLGPVVRAIAQDERSQLRNRELATERVLEQVREAARPRRKRTADGADEASRERRLEEKRRPAADEAAPPPAGRTSVLPAAVLVDGRESTP